MRVLADVHMYPPFHNAGAEWMLHAILSNMTSRGHSCRVMIHRGPRSIVEFQGVRVHVNPTMRERSSLWKWCDVALTHLDRTHHAQRSAECFGKPLAHLIHNHAQVGAFVEGPDLIVFNSQHLLRHERMLYKHDRCPTAVVCRPPVASSEYRVEREGTRVTLINLSDLKGGPLFFELARRMPEVPFLGVYGAYDPQMVPKDVPGNVVLHPNDPDAKKIYAQTRVLLVPSSYESYGRVAAEACASGIPVVCNPTPGLLECLGPAGIYIPRDKPDLWQFEINRLLTDASYYEQRSATTRARSEFLDKRSAADLDRCAKTLESLADCSSPFCHVGPSDDAPEPS